MSSELRTPLTESARRRHQETRQRARQALRDFEATGQPVTYAKIAQAAAVSRAWLYTQPDIRAAIDRLRDLNGRSTNTPIPARQRSSEGSLIRRLEAAHRRNQELSSQVTTLREQLAAAHADLRAAGRHQAPAVVDLTSLDGARERCGPG